MSEKNSSSETSLALLSSEEKEEYLRLLLPIFRIGEKVSQNGLRRLYQIFATMELGQIGRQRFLNAFFLESIPELHKFESSFDKRTSISLAKDALALAEATPVRETRHQASRLVEHLGITSAQIQFLHQWINWENKILLKIGRGDTVVQEEELPTELFKRAAAIGVPLGALYFSGSVIGFSAVGITSGLAMIGRMAVGKTLLIGLGLNPMTAGIVILLISGLTIKKILDTILPNVQGDKENLETAVQQMELLRNRYLQYLKEDQHILGRGAWWEIFTGRRKRRRLGNHELQMLLEAERNKQTVPT